MEGGKSREAGKQVTKRSSRPVSAQPSFGHGRQSRRLGRLLLCTSLDQEAQNSLSSFLPLPLLPLEGWACDKLDSAVKCSRKEFDEEIGERR